MSGIVFKRVAVLASLVVLLALPLAGKWLRRTSEPRCALDGGTLVAAYRVRVQDAAGASHDFCCIRCAEMWLERQALPARAVWVTDEGSGAEIDAATAYYVRSLVITTPTTGNRVHAFRDLADAERHADKCRGTILTGNERPFAINADER
jgi:hypothetical protein